jgi:uncharacterized lipoprotein YmbA
MKSYLLLPGLLLLTCCSVLTPVKDADVNHILDPLVPDRTLTNSSPAMAINRPSIPSYLDRQQVVTRSGGQLMISSVDLWGEPLDAAIARVTASNLSRLTDSTNIQPVEHFVTLEYTTLLEIRIARFEPDVPNQMIFEGTWKLQPVKGGETSNHFFRIRTYIAPSSPPIAARVNAMNMALEHLARQIANHF